MSKLNGKRILFLGSSVTYGAAAGGRSFVDELAARTGCEVVKEAVSGTTLADIAPKSYVARLRLLDPATAADLFVCQLSTNDASQCLPLGSPARANERFDRRTVAGAIETIVDYAQRTWQCPVVFYTSPRYDSEAYGAMVGLLKSLQCKWGFGVIDLWSDEAFNRISQEQRARWMEDSVHPTLEGYREWWTPRFERELEAFVE